MSYTLEALGSVIRECREDLKLTQEDLGTAAGYGAGAGVSISRIERGLSRPSQERLDGIALKLGCTRPQLEDWARQRAQDLAGGGKSGVGEESLKERMRRVQKRIDKRTSDIDQAGTAFNEAHDRAYDNFYKKFLKEAAGIEGAPQPDSTDVSAEAPGNPSKEAEAQRLRLKNRLEATLASGTSGTVAGVVKGDAGAYGALTAALMFGIVSSGPAIAGLSDAVAKSAASTWLGAGSRAVGGAGVAGSTALLARIVASPALPLLIQGALVIARRTVKQRRELAEQLAQVEAGLDANEKGYLALVEYLPWAAEILDYIAVHAGHALDRWQKELPPEPIGWDDLSPDQQTAYQGFITIAASQLSVITINVQALLTLQGKELDDLKDFDSAILTQAEAEVKGLV